MRPSAWAQAWRELRANWAQLVYLVRDAYANSELRYIPAVLGGVSLWLWLGAKGLEHWMAHPERIGPWWHTFLTTLIPVPFLGWLVWRLRRDRKERGEALARAVRAGRGKLGELRMYRWVSGSSAREWGLPKTEHLVGILKNERGEYFGVDHETQEIRPAKAPEDDAAIFFTQTFPEEEVSEPQQPRRYGSYRSLR